MVSSVMVIQLATSVNPSTVLDLQMHYLMKFLIGRKILHIKTGKYTCQT